MITIYLSRVDMYCSQIKNIFSQSSFFNKNSIIIIQHKQLLVVLHQQNIKIINVGYPKLFI